MSLGESSCFITAIPGDGCVGISEYRFDCVNRMAYKNVKELDDAYEKLLTVS